MVQSNGHTRLKIKKATWDKSSLNRILRENFQGYLFVIVSNREPYVNIYDNKGNIKFEPPIGGVAVAFDSILRRTEGIWVAHGSGEADHETVDEKNRILVPPTKPKYILRRVWMTEKERRGYYDGFSNETLWPLSHVVFVRPTFSSSDWRYYQKINKRFAKAVLEEIKGQKAIVWIQDYHLSLVSEYIKAVRPDVLTAQFWHIPWPGHEIFKICPWKKEILTGFLHNDLIGFHQYLYVNNFLNNIAQEVEAMINYEDLIVGFQGRRIKLGSFPISIDYSEIADKTKSITKDKRVIKRYIHTKYEILALGVDRLDYTKGIPNRLLAIDKFLENNPAYHKRFVYLGIAAPSRESLRDYRELHKEVMKLTDRINKKYETEDWRPINIIDKVVRRDEILRLSKFADLCLVTSLDDGMNLFAKEYISANKGDGALILSDHIGAAKELTEAYYINPYNVDEISSAIAAALETPLEERRERMKKMKRLIEERNVFRWAGKFLLELSNQKQS